MSDYLVVMTACVDPSTGPAKVDRSDPVTRLEDYRRALRFWLDYPDARLNKILFLENSGYALDELRREAENNPRNKQIEFVSRSDNDYPATLGYGYPELRMLDWGIQQSSLAQVSKYYVKATGRLMFPRVSRLLDRLPLQYDFAVDSRNNAWLVKRPQVFVTTQLMILSKDFYDKHIRALWQQMEGRGIYQIENLLWDELVRYRGRPGAILRWPVNVDPVGLAAHWRKNYTSPGQRVRNRIRAVARVVVPWWWL